MEPLEVTGVVAAAAAVATLVARVWLSVSNERKRTQPIVIAHEARPLLSQGGESWRAQVYLTNEGGGPAFNVRCGVVVRGLRWPYRYDDEDALTGTRQRVLRPGERRPEQPHTWGLDVPLWLIYLVGRGNLDSEVYWCRYENASGDTWETLNPPERSAQLAIRRRRAVRLRQRWAVRRIKRSAKNAGADEP